MKYVLLITGFLLVTNAQSQTKPKSAVAQKPVATIAAKKPLVTAQKPVANKPKETLVEISTNYGVMIAKLYNNTPLHRDNFIKLVKQGFYDSLLFHRVIKDFMIQGGDPDSKYAPDSVMVGAGSAPGDRIPAEFRNNLIHKRGALAAARDGNPAKASSNSQFYIVQGKKTDTTELNQIYQSVKANNPDFKYSAAQKEIYQRIGGTPFLDQNYTVFGEIISGLNVLDKIASVQIQPGDRPVNNIRMKIRLLN
jgi:peptidyl-prolyl cis-trans isomerase B (cyclophilin B)